MKTILCSILLALITTAFAGIEGSWHLDTRASDEFTEIVKKENEDFVRRAFGRYAGFILGEDALIIEKLEGNQYLISFPGDEAEPPIELVAVSETKYKDSKGVSYEFVEKDRKMSMKIWSEGINEEDSTFPLIRKTSEPSH